MSKYEPPASLDWDDPLPDQLAERWRQIIQELPDIQEVHIPRWIGFDLRHVSTLQLHIFCDGSSMAYAACAYFRASCTDGSVQVNLLSARSRVTPVKPLTIPRVELSGVLLCTQLADLIINQLQASHHTISVLYWSDAMIVLYWISALAEHVLKKEIYVDDVQTGHETVDGALRIRNDVIADLQSAGMELKKWATNHPDILEGIPTTDLSSSSIF